MCRMQTRAFTLSITLGDEPARLSYGCSLTRQCNSHRVPNCASPALAASRAQNSTQNSAIESTDLDFFINGGSVREYFSILVDGLLP